MNQTVIPRMRTLDAAHTLVREIDPDTALTRHALRALAVNGRIPVVMVGAKRLINIDALLDILATDPTHLSLDSTEQPLSAPILPVRRLPAR